MEELPDTVLCRHHGVVSEYVLLIFRLALSLDVQGRDVWDGDILWRWLDLRPVEGNTRLGFILFWLYYESNKAMASST